LKRFLCILFIALGIFSLSLNGQDRNQLRQYYNNSLPDTVRLMSLYNYIWDIIYTNSDTAEILVNKGLKDPATKKHPNFESKFYNAYGAISQLRYDYLSAINYYQKGLAINEKLNDIKGQAVMLGNIGTIYIKLRQHNTAISFQRKCLAALKKANDEYNQASVYNNLSIIESELKNYGVAMNYALKSKEIYEKNDDKYGLTYCHANIAALHEKQENLESALHHYKIASDLAKETDNQPELAKTLSEYGNVLFLMGRYDEALQYLLRAEKIANENNDDDAIMDIYNFLYEYHKKRNNLKLALDYYEKTNNYKNKLDRDKNIEEVNRKQFEYQYARRLEQDSIRMENERTLNSEKLKAKNAEIARAKTEKTAFIAFIVLLIIVAVITFNRFKISQKQKQIIEAKNKITEEQKLIIEEKQKEIVDSINYAKRIQDSLMDNFEPVKKFFSDAFVFLKPKDIVSGDFYWISKRLNNQISIDNNTTCVSEYFFIAVCDSTGHGVPGGFMSLLNIAYLSEAINEKNIYEPSKIFDYVRERLINTISKNEQKDGFDGTIIRFEKKQYFENKAFVKANMEISYAAAYNPPILIRNGELTELNADKMPVGFGERREQFSQNQISLITGDTIYMFTDGYADQFGGPNGKKFKYKQLNQLLLNHCSKTMDDQKSTLDKTFNDWKGDLEQVDDVCIIGIRI
jgi:serine phosphatase RsbU (regulator of sigma subunit)